MVEDNKCYQDWYDKLGRHLRSEIYFCNNGYRTDAKTGEELSDRCYDWKDSCSLHRPRRPNAEWKAKMIQMQICHYFKPSFR